MNKKTSKLQQDIKVARIRTAKLFDGLHTRLYEDKEHKFWGKASHLQAQKEINRALLICLNRLNTISDMLSNDIYLEDDNS